MSKTYRRNDDEGYNRRGRHDSRQEVPFDLDSPQSENEPLTIVPTLDLDAFRDAKRRVGNLSAQVRGLKQAGG